MYDIIWVIPTTISVSLLGFCLFMVLMESLQHKNILRFFIWLFAFFVLIVPSMYCCDMLCKGCSEAELKCRELGYQSTLYDNDSWYCVTFGNEPSIIKLEGVE